ncbi:MAG: GSU2403 family nucleotidyltransferase fold protein [Gemmatimonadaceae bacterium]
MNGDFAALARLLDVLRPWRKNLVVIGGWAHWLYRLHDKSNRPSYQTLQTKDVDLAFSLTSPPDGDIGAALKRADFHERLSGDHVPPVTRYQLGDGDLGFYAEFLVPLSGSATKRDGTPDATVAEAGVTAQKLRHLEILLQSPWTVIVDAKAGLPVRAPLHLQIANPVTFIAQKLLIHGERDSRKQAHDVLYIHDTLDLVAGQLGELSAMWQKHIRPTLSPKTAKLVERFWVEQFSGVTDVIRSAARIPQDRALSPENLQKACAYGLGEIFGSAGDRS